MVSHLEQRVELGLAARREHELVDGLLVLARQRAARRVGDERVEPSARLGLRPHGGMEEHGARGGNERRAHDRASPAA